MKEIKIKTISNISEIFIWFSGVENSLPLSYMALLIVFSLVPILFLCFSAFIKVSVVFAILRSALGAGSIPSGTVVSILALMLSFKVASPLVDNFQSSLKNNPVKLGTQVEVSLEITKRIKKEVSDFLRNNSSNREIEYFSLNSEKPAFYELVSAFILTELKEAFIIGLLLFVPFMIIDLVVSTILTSMGMMMLSPMTISLPIKIALFAFSDGWFRLSTSLLESY